MLLAEGSLEDHPDKRHPTLYSRPPPHFPSFGLSSLFPASAWRQRTPVIFPSVSQTATAAAARSSFSSSSRPLLAQVIATAVPSRRKYRVCLYPVPSSWITCDKQLWIKSRVHSTGIVLAVAIVDHFVRISGGLCVFRPVVNEIGKRCALPSVGAYAARPVSD